MALHLASLYLCKNSAAWNQESPSLKPLFVAHLILLSLPLHSLAFFVVILLFDNSREGAAVDISTIAFHYMMIYYCVQSQINDFHNCFILFCSQSAAWHRASASRERTIVCLYQRRFHLGACFGCYHRARQRPRRRTVSIEGGSAAAARFPPGRRTSVGKYPAPAAPGIALIDRGRQQPDPGMCLTHCAF